jgi:septal ring factor EnvC (AmiA/AmiB activator)
MSMSMSKPPPAAEVHDNNNKDEGVMSSIAALRQILMIDTPTKAMLSEKNANIALQQTRYDERKKYEEQLAEWQSKLTLVEQESIKEKSLRKTLETTYEALSQHKKELGVQLELVSKSRESLEERLAAVSKTLEEEKVSFARQRREWEPQLAHVNKERQAVLRQSGEWQSRFQASQRYTEELKAATKKLKKEIEAGAKLLEESKQSSTGEQQLLQKRLEEAETAQKKGEEEVSFIRVRSVGCASNLDD